ncbi:hypothetical protein [Amycolatopsis jejuensis]|uniref:hypothetical protein n=1 Tax=Amycolatopsis jejuensis TaxID=330084 RepID=UPI0005246045|nr:hypothetical protein [Amycolatopsis jejuensis]
MNDEVSVAELLVREGHPGRMPPPSRSRWRMVAVMLAVVVGCGAAAVLVSYGTTAHDEATGVTKMRVIQMPDRTEGAGGVNETNPPTITAEDTEQAGGGITLAPSANPNLDPLNDHGGVTPDSPAHPTSAAGPPSTSVPASTTQPPPSSSGTVSPTRTSTPSSDEPPPCVLLILCG